MSGTFFGLDLAARALRAQQAAVDVVNHNVANANTEGYSRQSVQLVTTEPWSMPGMNRGADRALQLGTGVMAGGVSRARDVFLDVQYRTAFGGQRQAEVGQQALDEIEVTFGEPSDGGINSLFDEYYRSWQELAGDPSDVASRAAVVDRAVSLAGGFNRAANHLAALQQDLDGRVGVVPTEINAITDQILTLNKQVVQVEFNGQRANDLRDRRDLLLDRLASFVGITATENADGSVDVDLGPDALVTGVTAARALTTTPTGPGGMLEVRFVDTNAPVTPGNAELKGLYDARDTTLPGYLSRLDQVASDLATAVNALHSAGYDAAGNTGQPFFTGTTAATLAVDPAIVADPDRVAAADAPGEAGNGKVALQIAQIRDASPSPDGGYRALISRLGVDSQGARGLAENQRSLAQMVDRRRQEVSGVSLDEEVVDLLRYQKAYEAAARLITATDQMLDKLINGTGIVGR